jgi:diaminopimelate epimerase
MRFRKYHALGNDYLVLKPSDFPTWSEPSGDQIRLVCHRNFGIGSDGILWGPLPAAPGTFGVRIFNPDGSEAEKSGNGTRIFSRFLWDEKLVSDAPFVLQTAGGTVRSVVAKGGRLITMDMGSVSFDSAKIPVTGPTREVIDEKITVGGREFTYCAATIGNPHCVLPLTEISAEIARRYGPELEVHPNFPRRTNVQFLQVIDRKNIRIEIWERGAGYTLASGTSSSAAAAVARRLGFVERQLTVHMPGGTLAVEIGDGYAITMTGPVTRVADGTLDPEMFS